MSIMFIAKAFYLDFIVTQELKLVKGSQAVTIIKRLMPILTLNGSIINFNEESITSNMTIVITNIFPQNSDTLS